MPINTLEYAQIFQTELDKKVVQLATTGWMEANAGQVKYTGGNEIKIPKINMDGLANYVGDTGYVQGSVTLAYETRTLTQDRGRGFDLDTREVDETNFVATAGNVMGEFQRTQVVPEIDAYRYSKLASLAIAANQKVVGGALTADTALEALLADLASIEDAGVTDDLIVTLSPVTARLLSQGKNWNNYAEDTLLSQGGLNLKIQAVNGAKLVRCQQKLLQSSFIFNDGTTAGQTQGGFSPDTNAVALNWIISSTKAPIAISKQDTVRIFDPMTYQDKNSWHLDYRRYHDLFVPDNQLIKVFVNTAA